MTKLQARLILFADEWLGIALCCWCFHYERTAFWPVFIAFVVLTYAISYPLYWRAHDRWWRRGDRL